jgi:hypothetical protein
MPDGARSSGAVCRPEPVGPRSASHAERIVNQPAAVVQAMTLRAPAVWRKPGLPGRTCD